MDDQASNTGAAATDGAERAAQLRSLKIDRDAAAPPREHWRYLLPLAVLLGGGFAWWTLAGPSAAPAATDAQGDASSPAVITNAAAAQPAQLPEASGRAKRATEEPTSAVPTGAAARPVSVLDATGYVVARRQATVSSKSTGKVLEVLIEEGDLVAAGQVLARLDASIQQAQLDLARSQAEAANAALAELEVQLAQARLDLERTVNLSERELASKADLDRDRLNVDALLARLERNRKDVLVSRRSVDVQAQVVADMVIRAPFAGVVIAKAAQPGEMISPVSAGGGFTRTGICTIVDMDSLEIEVDVNEAYINRVFVDQPVRAALNAYPDVDFEAYVIAIIPAADRNKATVRVRLGFRALDARILPDMGVRVAFGSGAR
ncbi:MAG: efflux RND transporter periplasmic adaptor subunit [Pseudomonadota bacterium]